MENYFADPLRYDGGMQYQRCGRSGVLLPKVSLGFWHNFGGVDSYERSREITHYAFDHGITHFDLANNYGPPYGSAEETMGRLMDDSFRPYRDELFISTKAGYDMWAGPYGNWGSRKYLMASLDQSLKRMHLDYVDLFYSHRYDPETPLEETLQCLVCVPPWTEAIAPVGEFRLIHQAQYLRYGLLDDAVNYGRNTELTHLASVLGYLYPADGIRTVFAVQQTFNYFHLVAPQIWEQMLHIHPVNATAPLVRLDLSVSSVKVVGSQDVLKHPV